MTEREFSYWLCNREGIGRVTAGRLLKRAGSAQAVYEMKEQELAGLLSAAQLKSFQRARKEKNVKQEYQMLLKRGIRFLPVSDPEYPARLQEIPDAPQGIYVRGGLPEEGTPSVAVIGARMCSEYGKQAARYFASALAAAGVQVVSGLARGIDGISQEAALDCGGRTYAVLGCGVDVCYPAENGRLFDRIPARGGIVSEYPPGTLPQARLFPPRNRIISGLSDLILVVEAREKSGTLITVDMALEQGREVFAIPGRVTDALSSGCNTLIRQGAGVAISPSALLEELGQNCRPRQMEIPSGKRMVSNCPRERNSQENRPMKEKSLKQRVAACLDFTPQTPGQLYEKMRKSGCIIPLPILMQQLLELHMEGAAGQEGGYFFRNGKN